MYEKRVCLPSRTAAGVAALMMETDMKTSKQNKCINLQEWSVSDFFLWDHNTVKHRAHERLQVDHKGQIN